MRNDFINDNSFSKIRQCSMCSLCCIQKPLLDVPCQADVMWVGLSAVRVDNVMTARPLSSDTRSGGLVEEIESRLSDLSFYRTNLVKCLPESQGKIRYPTAIEMKSCSPHLISEVDAISPSIVFMLGKQVAGHIFKQHGLDQPIFDKDFHYDGKLIGNTVYVPVHHPSFVLVYRRHDIKLYIDQICTVVRKNVPIKEMKTTKLLIS